MAVWTHIDKEGLLDNITVREHYEDGVLAMRELMARTGYAIYNTTQGIEYDENGEPLPPTYFYGIYMPVLTDINIFCAAPIGNIGSETE